MVNSVSTLGQFGLIQNAVLNTQDQLNTVQTQISTNEKAQTYGGLGGAATFQSLSLTANLNLLSTISDSITNVSTITSTMDSTMTNITGAATSVASAMQAMTQDSDPDISTISTEARNALTSIQNYLNTQSGNTYIFGASETSTAPVASTSALTTSVQADLSAFAAGTETPSTVLSNVTGYTATQMGYSSTLAGANDVTVPTGTNTSANYTVKADGTGFQNILQGLSIIANLSYGSNTNQSDFYQVFNGALGLITQGTSAVNQTQATLGVTTGAMATAQTQITATQTTLNLAITNTQDMTSADLTKASTTLTNLETQLQTSYTIIGQLQSLHLINYLNGSA